MKIIINFNISFKNLIYSFCNIYVCAYTYKFTTQTLIAMKQTPKENE
jgi:hypothetical protein